MDFVKKTLGDLTVGKGQYGIGASAVDYSEDLYTYLRITDINDDGTLNVNNLKSINDKNAERYLLQPNDIVFARTGNSTGRNYFYDGTDGILVYAGFLIKFSIDSSKVNPKYIKYYCMSDEYKGWVQGHLTGSTRGNINAQTYANMEISIPPREQQNRIVSILEELERKRKNNIAINRNLSEQAEALYRKMILDGSGEHRECVLSDIADIVMGQSPKGDTYNDDGDGVVFYQGRAEFGERFPTRRLFTTDPKRMAKENSVLMSVRAPVGDINVAYEECCIGRGLCSVSSKDNHQSFILYTMYSLKDKLDVYNGEGTVFGSINKDSMKCMTINVPNKELMDKFEEIARPMDAMIKANYDENCRLVAMRDGLLLKLMSGELDVSEADI